MLCSVCRLEWPEAERSPQRRARLARDSLLWIKPATEPLKSALVFLVSGPAHRVLERDMKIPKGGGLGYLGCFSRWGEPLPEGEP
jgi:hypothetical protein